MLLLVLQPLSVSDFPCGLFQGSPFNICLAYPLESYLTNIFVPHNLLNLLCRFLSNSAKISSFCCSCFLFFYAISFKNIFAFYPQPKPIACKLLPIIAYNYSSLCYSSFLALNCSICFIFDDYSSFFVTLELLQASWIFNFQS